MLSDSNQSPDDYRTGEHRSRIQSTMIERFSLTPKATRQFARLSRVDKEALTKTLGQGLSGAACEPIQSQRKYGLRKFRVGDLRIALQVRDNEGFIEYLDQRDKIYGADYRPCDWNKRFPFADVLRKLAPDLLASLKPKSAVAPPPCERVKPEVSPAGAAPVPAVNSPATALLLALEQFVGKTCVNETTALESIVLEDLAKLREKFDFHLEQLATQLLEVKQEIWSVDFASPPLSGEIKDRKPSGAADPNVARPGGSLGELTLRLQKRILSQEHVQMQFAATTKQSLEKLLTDLSHVRAKAEKFESMLQQQTAEATTASHALATLESMAIQNAETLQVLTGRTASVESKIEEMQHARQTDLRSAVDRYEAEKFQRTALQEEGQKNTAQLRQQIGQLCREAAELREQQAEQARNLLLVSEELKTIQRQNPPIRLRDYLRWIVGSRVFQHVLVRPRMLH